jgi:adenylosuccinate lyase
MLDRYCSEEMKQLWDLGQKYQYWLKVELAACRAMEAKEMVPRGTVAKIEGKVELDPQKILEIEKVTRHDVIAFLTHVENQVGEPARWLHLGLTSSDILDTSFALQLKQALEMIITEAEILADHCSHQALEHKDTIMIGRTHGIQAEPSSMWVVFAMWYAEMVRNIKRLRTALCDISFGKIAGAVGNYANLDPEVEKAALDELGLKPEPAATQVVQRDRHAFVFSTLAIMAGTVEKMAVTIRHWQRTEVHEAAEPFGKGQKGSSAMPHKRNPILCENITGLARTIRSYAAPALENIALWHERDISHSSVERIIAPDATSLTQFMLKRAGRVVSGLDIFPKNLARNLELTGGLVLSEAVLLEIVKEGVGRQKAYEAVQSCAMEATEKGGDFRELLRNNPLIKKHLGEKQLDKALNINHHVRHCNFIIRRALAEKY